MDDDVSVDTVKPVTRVTVDLDAEQMVRLRGLLGNDPAISDATLLMVAIDFAHARKVSVANRLRARVS